MAKDSELWIVYHVERQGEGKKSFYTRVGHGFKNKDGSFGIKLKLLPLHMSEDDTLYFQKYTPKEKSDAESFSE